MWLADNTEDLLSTKEEEMHMKIESKILTLVMTPKAAYFIFLF